ncbi:MAG: symmetrical bis(5'-nucleosyl)-tetraphosphatase [Pseudomonadaceae bacterium]|nr:symmetrical bis(5'-nucleosyl)-tetraphosphatase [Pseudomonadaceae bacterium]
MARYAVGDIQGCASEFEDLLDKLRYSPSTDELYLLGDLINRGPDSLAALRRAEALDARVVLGNHDLHWLAIRFGGHKAKRRDTLADLSSAADSAKLADWLLRQPLLIDTGDFVLTHAGMPPMWTLEQACDLAGEVAAVIAGPARARASYFEQMYGSQPDRWRDDLSGMDRLRCITNYFTRMRFIDDSGRLDFESKGSAKDAPDGYRPWFEVPRAQSLQRQIAFGHWAAIMGESSSRGVHALDTGCVWGQRLTALNLDSLERVWVPSQS